MDIDRLRKLGAFVADRPVKRSVVWTRFTDEGDKEELAFDVWVIKPSFGQIEDVVAQSAGSVSVRSALIASCIRLGEDGKGQFTLEEVRALDPGLATALSNAITEAGVDLAKKPNRQARTKKSGSS